MISFVLTLDIFQVNYAISKKLGGVMVWSIETEDFKGIGGTTNPLLRAIKSAYVSTQILIYRII